MECNRNDSQIWPFYNLFNQPAMQQAVGGRGHELMIFSPFNQRLRAQLSDNNVYAQISVVYQ